MRPHWLTPSEEFRVHGTLCVETQEHLLDYQITFDFVQTVQEQLDDIVKCLPKRLTRQAQEIRECVGKIEALLLIYQETLE